jgi:DNA-directed RNA polymerase subunit RPC12/RpoP
MVTLYECLQCGQEYQQDSRRTRACIYCGSRRAKEVIENEEQSADGEE